MKHLSMFFAICSLFVGVSFAADNNIGIEQEQQAKQLMEKQKILGFLENKGQITDMEGKPAPYILFKVESVNMNIWVTDRGITYQFFKLEEEHENKFQISDSEFEMERGTGTEKEKISSEWQRVDMILKNASIKKENIFTEGDITQGKVDYYLAHCPDGIFNVKTYAKITVKNVYPGIDWVLYANLAPSADGMDDSGFLKHEFIVHPNANPSQIKLIYEGSGTLKVQDKRIRFENDLGEVTEGELLCYQGDAALPLKRVGVRSNYTLTKNAYPLYLGAGNTMSPPSSLGAGGIEEGVFSYEVGIEIGNYNPDENLTIDPQLMWGTYYGGNVHDGFSSVKIDAAGNLFIAGYTASSDFPTYDPLTGAYYSGTYLGPVWDGIILKFNVAGARVWSTYYAGTDTEDFHSLALDGSGNVYVAGQSISTDFPTLFSAGAYWQPAKGGGLDAVILKFDNAGVRLWATYYGGSSVDQAFSLATDAGGNVFMTGESASADFPSFNSGTYYQAPTGASVDIFIVKFDNTGALVWGTVYGGTSVDRGFSIATDGSNVFVTGTTNSTDFPTLNALYAANQGGYDAFILKFSNTGVRQWATYYGGSGAGEEEGKAITTDASGDVFVAGNTYSDNFPTYDPGGGAYYDATSAASEYDIFIMKLSSAGALLWSTYYGGSGWDLFYSIKSHKIVTDASGNLYVTGMTNSNFDFPTYDPGNGAYYQPVYAGGSQDAFLLQFNNAGVRLWATYTGAPGGSYNDFGSALAVYPGVTGGASNCFIAIGEWVNSGSNGLLFLAGAYNNSLWSGGDDSYIMKFCPTSPLPIELLYFNAIAENSNLVRCYWSTATEINNDYFAIERSKDGTIFEQIGTVKGAGNSSTTLNYVFYDEHPYMGISYYRLRQVDYDGAFTYSPIRPVYIGTLELISIYPNPSIKGSIEYMVASEAEGEVSVKVYDVLGRIVISSTETLEGGVVAKKLSTEGLSSGSYLLQVVNRNIEMTQKQFVIE